ncbi:MAG: formylglycine-generating enzyme family protein [Kiritimatiellaeota bacterium]|nr:formylglycine-generating enzyme family protein [Kiritimatiellota bacterium]
MNINRMMAAFAAITLTAVTTKGQTTYLGPALPITNITANAGLVTLNWDDYTGITGFKLYTTPSLDAGQVDWQPMTDAQTGLIRINPGESGDHVFALGDTAVTFIGIGDKRFYRLVAVKGGTPPNDPGYPYPYTPDPEVTWTDRVGHTLVINLTNDFKATKLPADFKINADPAATTDHLYLRYITATSGGLPDSMGSLVAGEVNAVGTALVTLEGYYIGAYTVTEYQYRKVTGANPPGLASPTGDGRPVAMISWDDVRGNPNGTLGDTAPGSDSFLSLLQAAVRANNPSLSAITFDLPTEAQWEVACRAGTEGSISNTNTAMTVNITVVTAAANEPWTGTISQVAWWSGDNPGAAQVPGQKRANPAGLYDMHGNMEEWCLDCWNTPDSSTTAYIPVNNGNSPVTSGTSANRSLRGGYWGAGSSPVRSAYRYTYTAGGRHTSVGFRLCAMGAAMPEP